MTDLPSSQIRLLLAVRSLNDRKIPATYKQIADMLNVSRSSAANYVLCPSYRHNLIQGKFLSRPPFKAGGLRITDKGKQAIRGYTLIDGKVWEVQRLSTTTSSTGGSVP